MNISVSPLELEALRAYECDLVLAAIGYEARCRHFVTSVSLVSRRRVAVAFEDRHVLDYDQNAEAIREKGFEVVQESEDRLLGRWRDMVATALSDAKAESRLPRIVVDISSMSRGRIGSLVQALAESPCATEVVFVYSIGSFDPNEMPREMVQDFGPISPWYMGQVDSPRNPIRCIIGLGIERFAVLGVIEVFEPHALHIFVPTAEHDDYQQRTDRVARELLGGVGRSSFIRYPVDSPYASFAMLNSCVSASACSAGRAIIVPFGPKVFALVAALVAAEHWPRVAVWRAAGSTREAPVQRHAAGPIVAVKCRFLGRSSTGASS